MKFQALAYRDNAISIIQSAKDILEKQLHEEQEKTIAAMIGSVRSNKIYWAWSKIPPEDRWTEEEARAKTIDDPWYWVWKSGAKYTNYRRIELALATAERLTYEEQMLIDLDY